MHKVLTSYTVLTLMVIKLVATNQSQKPLGNRGEFCGYQGAKGKDSSPKFLVFFLIGICGQSASDRARMIISEPFMN